MFEAKVGDGTCTVKIDGSLLDIMVEVSRAVGAVYESLQKADPVDAETYREGITIALKKDAPTWRFMKNYADGTSVVIQKPQKKGDAPTGQS